MKPGIYGIKNLVDGKVYIGRSKHINGRFGCHRFHLRNGNHSNLHLQNAWNKYGEEKFEFTILRQINDYSREKLVDIEQSYLDFLFKNYDKNNFYNIESKADNSSRSQESVNKFSGKNNPRWKGGKIELNCKKCGATFKRKPSQKERSKFCSKSCQGKYQSKGEKNASAKLSESEVIEIKKLLKEDDHTQEEIGKMFNVSRGAVKSIKNGNTWDHISLEG